MFFLCLQDHWPVKNKIEGWAVCPCRAIYCLWSDPILNLRQSQHCANMTIKQSPIAYWKQWQSLCPSFPLFYFFPCPSSISLSVLWDIVFVQVSPVYPHKQNVSHEDGPRMLSLSHTHTRACRRNTSWQLSCGITMTSNTERQSRHWAPRWTLVFRGQLVTHYGKDCPHQSVFK